MKFLAEMGLAHSREHILRKLAGGMTIDEILADHPHLIPDDRTAAADCPAQETSSSPVGSVCEPLASLGRGEGEGAIAWKP